MLKARLLQAVYSIRSERQLVERSDTDLLFRWFLDMAPASDAFDATVFMHNRPRLDALGLTGAFFAGTVRRALRENQASEDHVRVDGTLIESYAFLKNFVPKAPAQKQAADGPNDSNRVQSSNPEVGFQGERRTHATHVSTTDPEARLYKKGQGQEAKLRHMGHVLTDNRRGLVLAVAVTEAAGDAEPAAALAMLDEFQALQPRKP